MNASTLPCIRGCHAGGRHRDDCAGEECTGCAPRPAVYGARLCRPCLEHLRGILTGPNCAAVADRRLTEELGQHIPAVAYDRDGGSHHDGCDVAAPLDVARLDARTDLRRVVSDLNAALNAHRELVGPARRDMVAMIDHLARWIDELARWDSIGEWYDALAWCMSQAHALAPWRADMRHCHGVPCPECSRADLVVYAGESHVTCRACGCLTHRDLYLAHVERVARDVREGADGHTLAELALVLGKPLPTVRSWVQRGRLLPVGRRGSARTYSLARARELRDVA